MGTQLHSVLSPAKCQVPLPAARGAESPKPSGGFIPMSEVAILSCYLWGLGTLSLWFHLEHFFPRLLETLS